MEEGLTMKFFAGTAAAAAFFLAPGMAAPVMAADQEVTTEIRCASSPGARQSCPVSGDLLKAGVSAQISPTPCVFGYTWGFDENGIYTQGGCAAQFAVTVAKDEKTADPEKLGKRVKRLRDRVRELRAELDASKQEKAELEAALNEVRTKGSAAQNTDRTPIWAARAVNACSNRAIKRSERVGNTSARISQIISAQRVEGAWLVIGQKTEDGNNGRTRSFFRCWSERGKIVNFEDTI